MTVLVISTIALTLIKASTFLSLNKSFAVHPGMIKKSKSLSRIFDPYFKKSCTHKLSGLGTHLRDNKLEPHLPREDQEELS